MKIVAQMVCMLFSLLLVACGQNPQLGITAANENGRTVFTLVAGGINGVLGFSVMEGTNMLWEITTSYEKGGRIVYGVLPTSGNMPARQIFPPSGTRPQAIGGKTVTVRLIYQSDRFAAPRSGTFTKTMGVPSPDQGSPANAAEPRR